MAFTLSHIDTSYSVGGSAKISKSRRL